MGAETSNVFRIAQNRNIEIPRGGWIKARYQLSVAPHPEHNLPKLDPIGIEYAATHLNILWGLLHRQRVHEESPSIKSFKEYEYESLSNLVFAPTTEELFKNAIAPVI